MNDQIGNTPLSELGEFGLINRFKKNISPLLPTTIKGIGDDAAVIDIGDKYLLVTTDMLTEGVHFDLIYTPLKHLGYKAVIANLSDIYAMNGTATQITVSIAISSKFSVEAIDELYTGIQQACTHYEVDLVGGDTTSSMTGLVISITALGHVEKSNVVYRSGAKKGDLVVVTGDLGGAYMGLHLLNREKEVFKIDPKAQPVLDNYTYILQRQLRPEARKDICQFFNDNKILPSSMIDVSDGLSSELLHLCTESHVGCAIEEEKLPIDPQTKKFCIELNIDTSVAIMNGGEDYELLFTIHPKHEELCLKNSDFTVIGKIVDAEEGESLISSGFHQKVPLKAQGWNALKNQENM